MNKTVVKFPAYWVVNGIYMKILIRNMWVCEQFEAAAGNHLSLWAPSNLWSLSVLWVSMIQHIHWAWTGPFLEYGYILSCFGDDPFQLGSTIRTRPLISASYSAHHSHTHVGWSKNTQVRLPQISTVHMAEPGTWDVLVEAGRTTQLLLIKENNQGARPFPVLLYPLVICSFLPSFLPSSVFLFLFLLLLFFCFVFGF